MRKAKKAKKTTPKKKKTSTSKSKATRTRKAKMKPSTKYMRPSPPKKWSNKEEALLKRLYRKGIEIRSIAKKLKRTPGSIKSKVHSLGLRRKVQKQQVTKKKVTRKPATTLVRKAKKKKDGTDDPGPKRAGRKRVRKSARIIRR